MKTCQILLFSLLGCALTASAVCNVVQHRKLNGKDPGETAIVSGATPGTKQPEPAEEKKAEKAPEPDKTTPGKTENKKPFLQVESSYCYTTYSGQKQLKIYFNGTPSDDMKFEIKPEIRFSASKSYSGYTVSANFEYDTVYTITVKPGTEKGLASGLRPMQKDAHFVYYQPRSEMKRTIRFLIENRQIIPLHAKNREIPVSISNPAKKINVTVSRVMENNLVSYLQFCPYGSRLQEKIFEQELPVAVKEGEAAAVGLELDKIGFPRKPGIYTVALDQPSRSWRDNSCDYLNFIVTDLMPSIVFDGKNANIAVRKISDPGQAVADCTVKLYSYKNQLLSSVKTDKNGHCVIDCHALKLAENDSLSYLIAEKDGDANFLDTGFSPRKDKSVTAFISGERDLCRPGETISIMAVLQTQGKAAANLPVTCNIHSPAAKIYNTVVKTDENGCAAFRFVVPEDAPLGTYRITLASFSLPHNPEAELPSDAVIYGSASIRVAEYIPDTIRLSLNGDMDPEEKNLELKGSAEYYFGAPFANETIVLNFTGLWKQFTSEKFSGYTFSVPPPKETPSINRIFQKTDHDGKFSATVALPDTSAEFLPVCYSVRAETQGGGRTVSATLPAKIKHNAPYYIGIKTKNFTPEQRTFSIVAVDKDDKQLKPSRTVTAELSHVKWVYGITTRQDGSDFYGWRQEEDIHETVQVNLQETEFTLPLHLSGNFILRIKDQTEKILAEYPFWSYSGSAGKPLSDPNALTFRLDREKVLPGGTVTITFHSAADGIGSIAAGSEKIGYFHDFAVKKGENKIPLAIPANTVTGSYYAAVSVITKMQRLYGNAAIQVDQEAKKLNVALTLPKKAEPGSTVPVTVTLNDAKTKSPAAGTVQLWAVDSGILALSAFKTPDPFRFFFSFKEHCPFITVHGYDAIFNSAPMERKLFGGGAVRANAVYSKYAAGQEESNFVSVVVPLQTLQVSGSRTVQVKLPPHTGELRFMALAANQEQTGSGEAHIRLHHPISLQVTAPRVLAPGDTFTVSMDFFNTDFADGNAEWKINDKTGTVKLAKGGSAKAEAVFTAGKADTKFNYTASLSMNGKTVSVNGAVTIRVPVPLQDIVTVETVKPGETKNYIITGKYNSLEVGAPAVILRGALAFLKDYPYGCLEQTTSRAFPFLAVSYLAKNGIVDQAFALHAATAVESAAAKLLLMQRNPGWYSMWQGHTDIWEAGSIYANHFLLEADAAGHKVLTEQQKEQIDSALCHYINARKNPAERRAYAVYVLSLLHPAKAAGYAEGYMAEKELDKFHQFLMAAVMIRGGRSADGMKYMRNLLSGKFYAENSSVDSAFNTQERKLGLMLWILAEILPDEDAAPYLAELQKRIKSNGHWGTTQSNAWAVLGLSRHLAKDGSGELFNATVNGKKFDGKTQVLTGHSVIVNKGTTPLFIRKHERMIPEKVQNTAEHIRITKTILDSNGKELTPKDGKIRVKAGDLLTVRLHITDLSEWTENLVICDLLPGGLEIEDTALATRVQNTVPTKESFGRIKERRYDRFLCFGDGEGKVTYQVRAVTKGTFSLPPVLLEAMYNPDMKSVHRPAEVLVVE